MTTREELHKLIDTLTDDQIAEVRQYIDELRGGESLSEETLKRFTKASMTSITAG